MPAPSLLEVIALDADDARAAVRGGADRLEIVQDMSTDGLTPSVDGFARIRDAVDVPLRVMLRPSDRFAVSARELDELCSTAAALRVAGMVESVVGFLTDHGEVDEPALRAVLAAAAPRRWTFHRAIDHAADAEQACKLLAGLPGLDAVLTAGSASGLDFDGLAQRLRFGAAVPWVVGGGLRLEQVATLRAAGVTRFHVGSRVRYASSWARPVDVRLVRAWRAAVDAG